ncbi:DUF2332 domain-containing protein [Cellulomonas bogoriensis]|uniref:DUF2332 domain-containing protein n=1 Tax=Cellulomonas bogoriensis 69B4 = DSM 16987 TaxID=1386082 RepID=A0A0A0BMA4_9CELL|nr:DUF2332 domain-containing protein [Cellulomonas bogoriensis]KGM09638.1 hypothetical protein N869_06380 [Cellulomonas bogoriensis 69B4 = DSM 16987]
MDPTTHRGTGDLAEAYRRFARLEARGTSPVYERWSEHISTDPDVLGLLTALPAGKRQPNLVLAAARWHGASATVESLRSTLLDRWPAVRETILERSTQTNEAARCATLLPFLAALPQPLALIEVGAAGGLCLLPDRYSYRYDDGTHLDPDDGPSPVVLPCTLGPGARPPSRMPVIAWRAGIDLSPVDVRDGGSCRWLETLVWPEHTDRRARLALALDLARRDPPAITEGDLLDALPGVVAGAPDGVTVVVIHSAVLAYLDGDARERFAAQVTDLADHWVSNEGPRVLPSTAPLAERAGRDFVVTVDGTPRAFAEPHGRHLRGLGD